MVRPGGLAILATACWMASAAATADAQNLVQALPGAVQGPVRQTQGMVISVARGNRNWIFRIRPGTLRRLAAGLPAARQSFQADLTTQFTMLVGGNRIPASFAALRTGQFVTVQAQGAHATAVQIMPTAGYARRGHMYNRYARGRRYYRNSLYYLQSALRRFNTLMNEQAELARYHHHRAGRALNTARTAAPTTANRARVQQATHALAYGRAQQAPRYTSYTKKAIGQRGVHFSASHARMPRVYAAHYHAPHYHAPRYHAPHYHMAHYHAPHYSAPHFHMPSFHVHMGRR